MNLTTYTVDNRTFVMASMAPTDAENGAAKVLTIQALIDYFYRREEMAQ